MGQGPIGGDVPEAERTPDPDNRPVIVEREYLLSHYFDKLSRRFSDQDPVVIRKRIQYTGYRYSIF